MEEDLKDKIDLREYLRIVIKRRWIVFAIFSIIVLSVAIHTFSQPSVYQATARILIEKENPNVVSIQEVVSVDASSDYFDTQCRIIESRTVARKVISRLNLKNSKEFFPPPKKDIISKAKRWVQRKVTFYMKWVESLLRTGKNKTKTIARTITTETTESNPDSALVRAFTGRIGVGRVQKSRLVDVTMEARDPVLATRMVNALVKSYIDHNLETKLQATQNAVRWLTDRIDEERKKVEAAEQTLLRYKESENIITDFSSDVEKITAQKLAELNARVVQAETARVEAETRYKQAMALGVDPGMLDSIPEVLQNPLIRSIKQTEVDLYNRISELSKKYGQNHPKMVGVHAELEDLQKRKAQEVRRVINSLRNQYQLAVAKEGSLRKALNDQKTESLVLNKKAIQFGVLKRQAESADNMYNLLVNRFKEMTITEEVKTGNVRIIDEAEVPTRPIKPRTARALIFSVVAGLTVGIGLAFFLEYLDNTVKGSAEVKAYFDIPFLGPIPAFSKNGDFDGIPPDLVTIHSPKSSATESFRGLRTNVFFSSVDVSPKVILVSSTGPQEGKTTCAANLAVTMAHCIQTGSECDVSGEANSRVLLMDCDMRRPRIHELFEIRRDLGVSNFLVGTVDLENTLISTSVSNLDVMLAGHIPPNPSELLGSQRMRNLIDTLRKSYHCIVIDSPPITAVTDTIVLSKLADGIILVISAGNTPRQFIQSGLDQLRSVNGRIIGAVLNGIDMGQRGANRYQYYYYYYADDESTESEKKKRT